MAWRGGGFQYGGFSFGGGRSFGGGSSFGGGFPFGEGSYMGGRGHAQPAIDNNKYYQLLGVPKTIKPEEVRKAFREKAKTTHPDKGGDPAKFAEISQAADILSDPEKKKVYDMYGEEGLNKGIKSTGGFTGGRQIKKPKNRPTVHTVSVSLEEVFTGSRKTLKINHLVPCSGCNGMGCSRYRTCPSCNGEGFVGMHTPMGLVGRQCMSCRDGHVFSQADVCRTCRGGRITQVQKEIHIDIEKGVPEDFRYTLKGEGDFAPGLEIGDIHLDVRSISSRQDLRRRGTDLVLKKTISLAEAATGFSFKYRHLDGHDYVITAGPGEAVRSGSIKTVEDLGLPVYHHPVRHGNLFITFDVELPGPNYITYDVAEKLRICLGVEDSQEDTWDIKQENVHQAERSSMMNEGGRVETVLDKPIPRDPPRQRQNRYQRVHSHRREQCSGTIF